MIPKQHVVGNMSVFCYLLGSENTGQCLVIDPAGEGDQVVSVSRKADLSIRYIFNTPGC
jgi:glyoxylase-like metal-dependent hydrolase (beta-lactamase superfamily II)